ncbi:indole-3-glycerol phosphate synthase [Actinobacteria bacterium IMCC26256]|nr:indole-3-glycerol phosphate synthase [Actinobacteria bacterium IMCC26256]
MLNEILATKRDEVTVLRLPQTRDLLRRTALDAEPPRDFLGALSVRDSHLKVISEFKRRSPSKGELAPNLDPSMMALCYEQGGAAAMSVLTDQQYFGGSVADLQNARAAMSIPVLRKDFIIDEVQIYESRAIGADAILLILAAIPEDSLLMDLHACAVSLGMGVLVEAHSEDEVERVVGLGLGIVGVNARNLADFAEDREGVAALATQIPPGVVAVAESAIRSLEDAAKMADAGFNAVLVGEALVRHPDPSSLVAAMSAVSVSSR